MIRSDRDRPAATSAWRGIGICNEIFGNLSPAAAMTMAAGVGYTGWEVAPSTLCDRPTEWPDRDRRDYAQTIVDAGLRCIGLHWLLAGSNPTDHENGLHLTSPSVSIQRRTADYLKRCAGLCADLGGTVMVLGSPDQRTFPPDQTHAAATDAAVAVLRSIAPTLDDVGVSLAIEPLGRSETNFLTTAAETVDLIGRVDHPRIRLHLDVKAMSEESESPATIVRRHAKHLIHFHANDPNRRGPGMGTVPFGPILEALADVAYDGWVSVEPFDLTPGLDETLHRSFRTLKL